MEERRMLVVKLIMMVGISGSGKSYYANKIAEKENGVVFSSDTLRAELYGDENDQSHNQEVFNELHKRIRNHLREGGVAIYDATNLNMKRRMAFLQELKRIPCEKEVVLVLASRDKCIEQNDARERKVPHSVIDKQIKQFQCPQKFEGWDNIRFAFEKLDDCLEVDELLDRCDIPHDNPHHKLNIKEHMVAAASMKDIHTNDVIVVLAAKYHDIGKPFCKEFKDSRGNPSESAHYYNHHNVSAYFFLCSMMNSFQEGKKRIERKYGDCFDKLGESLAQASVDFGFWEVVSEMTFLINYHMEPFLKSEKAYKRFEELIGEERAERLRLLHECDLAAH